MGEAERYFVVTFSVVDPVRPWESVMVNFTTYVVWANPN